ncbi:N-terminal EF-hand calcium-binding protein 3 [Varanus komodoensis]|nr:N-terminal EF-hand calcium-binding protein 3 [Varanus komodoensis]
MCIKGNDMMCFALQKCHSFSFIHSNVDDGKLSFEEFKNCCADGILSSEELWELFSGIDRSHSGNLETEKFCDYFSEHLGEYRHVLSALEQLNTAVLTAMDKTKLVSVRCCQTWALSLSEMALSGFRYSNLPPAFRNGLLAAV